MQMERRKTKTINQSSNDDKMTCKGICVRTRVVINARTSGGIYATGHAKCNTCAVYFKTDKNWCVCCNTRLSHRARNPNYKRKHERL